MPSINEQLFALAAPYLDTRDNGIHTEIAYALAQRLLEHYPDADAGVVLPAVILHDVGWKTVPEELQLTAFGPNMSNPALQRRHETEGARIAGEILVRLGYDAARAAAVVEIIDGHDTRKAALSLEDQLVKDADKLWRFTANGIEIDHQRFAAVRESHVAWLATKIDDWLFTREARDLARELLTEA